MKKLIIFSGILFPLLFVGIFLLIPEANSDNDLKNMIPPDHNDWCEGADINKDGKVGFYEFSVFGNNYNRTDCSEDNDWCDGADRDKDGKVGFFEFSDLVNNYGRDDCKEATCVCEGDTSCGYEDCLDNERPHWYCSEGSCLYSCVDDLNCQDIVGGDNNWCNGADRDKDGKVGFFEFSDLANNYGRDDCSMDNNWCDGADRNKDGKVGFFEFAEFANHNGRTDCKGCIDECSSGEVQCSKNISKQTCGNYDDDDCLEWSEPQSCEGDISCGYEDCLGNERPVWYCSEGNCLYNCVDDSDNCQTIVSSPFTGGGVGGYVSPKFIQGDINKDGKVDKYDFALLMSAWQQTGANDSDLNGDNKVDKYDLALLMSNWGAM